MADKCATGTVVAVTLMCLLLDWTACPGDGAASWRRVSGRYSNKRLGFSVQIPKGMTGHAIDEPATHPEIGVVVYFGDGPSMRVFAEESRFGGASALEAVATVLGCHGESDCESSSPREATLGALAGASGVKKNRGWVTEVVLAYRPAERTLVYCGWLMTTPGRYLSDRAVFHAMLTTFRTQPQK
jgi:hypothetical protein